MAFLSMSVDAFHVFSHGLDDGLAVAGLDADGFVVHAFSDETERLHLVGVGAHRLPFRVKTVPHVQSSLMSIFRCAKAYFLTRSI